MSNYIPTIGLEIHAELKTKTKMFCDSPNNPDEKNPNVNVCPVCMAHPGTLPTINREAVEKMIKIGLALNCDIAEYSKFDRKSYFYPDLPKGYQISQYDMPICLNGYLEIGDNKVVHLERIHLEEDAGTLKHSNDKYQSYVDYNRAGLPLMELVTKPDIHSAEDIEKFARELQLILRYLEASDANIEKGQMRVEVNLSIAKEGSEKLGTKVEVKNIGSIAFARKAAEYEIKRQTSALESGDRIVQETRGWDDFKSITFSQRIKEGSSDYRYFPEPDLPPMRFTKEYIETLRSQLPELPNARRKRFKKIYDIRDDQIEIFVNSKNLGDYFENVASEVDAWSEAKNTDKPGNDDNKKLYTLAANYIITEFPALARQSLGNGGVINPEAFIDNFNLKPQWLADIIVRIANNELSSTNAKKLQ